MIRALPSGSGDAVKSIAELSRCYSRIVLAQIVLSMMGRCQTSQAGRLPPLGAAPRHTACSADKLDLQDCERLDRPQNSLRRSSCLCHRRSYARSESRLIRMISGPCLNIARYGFCDKETAGSRSGCSALCSSWASYPHCAPVMWKEYLHSGSVLFIFSPGRLVY